jgi:hypothetical protein
MAQSSILKSASITNLDATPIVRPYVGQGAAGALRVVNDYVTSVSADDTGSRYRICRFPTTAKVKRVLFSSKVATAGSFDVSVAYSDSANDGTAAAFASQITIGIPTTANKLFGSAVTFVGTGLNVDYTYSGTYTPPMANITMWQNLVTLGCTDFAADPGGFFDIYMVCTTAVTTGGLIGCEVHYCE